MSAHRYFTPVAGLPPQQSLLTDRAVITEAYTFIPRGVLRDIVTSRFPHWHGTRAWVLSRPVAGFATTFSQSIVELDSGGGSERPEPGAHVECVLFVMSGELRLTLDDTEHTLSPGGYAYVAPATRWTVANAGNAPVCFHWIRKAYQPLEGIEAPECFVASDHDVEPVPMPDTDGAWATTRFVDARRPAPRHAREHRDLPTGSVDSVRRDPCHGTWALRAGGQGGVPAQPGLGGGRGR